MPWRTVLGNVAYAVTLEMARLGPRQGRGARADVHRSGRPDRRRAQAAVGAVRRHEAARRHRARALDQPKMLLMDEPFSALDALTRGTLQDEVCRICLETGQTVFMITHDVDEAIYLADRILLMTNGPGAVLAEIVENPLPKDRGRTDLHRHPLLLRGAQPPRRFPGQPQQEFCHRDARSRSAQRAGGADRQVRTGDRIGFAMCRFRKQGRRHGRACPGHPRLPKLTTQDVDARRQRRA